MAKPARPPDSPLDESDAELRKAVLHTFLMESEDRLADMEEALIALERRPDDDDLVQTIFRCAHTLKGNASSLGFSRLSEFAHGMEDLLQRFRSRTLPVTGDAVSLLLRGVDALRDLVLVAPTGRETADPVRRELLDRIRALSRERDRSGTAARAVVGEHAKDPQAPASDGVRHPGHGSGRARTLRVDIGTLDRLLDLVGEIAIADGRLGQSLERHAATIGDSLDVHRELGRLFDDLQEVILKVRMVPVGPSFRPYARMVRDLARSLGKSARLEVEGDAVEVDTTIIEALKDPITHIIRNALDHGIEPPDVRAAKGKPATGRITLRASRDTGHLMVQVEDDGAGLDRRKILDVAKTKGLSVDHVKSDQDALRLIFEPGFSTAETVTELSGRGVGMDVVRKNVDALRGLVTVESRAGEGTRIIMRVPLTLAVIDGFAVGVAGDTFVVPLGDVLECLDTPDELRGCSDPVGLINLRGSALPYLRLRALFGRTGDSSGRESVVVVRDQDTRAGLVVDALYGERQAVIKPLGAPCSSARAISGATILGTGRVALIVDVSAALRQLQRTLSAVAA
jgi:two-component system chemotaxis sensor kinase CheA